MRVIADTNVIVSGLFWRGAPRQVLEAAHSGAIEIFSSISLMAELRDVLGRGKFAQRLEAAGLSANDLVNGYAALVTLVEPAQISAVIADDPDDDAVLECAIAARAEVIISGDSHLLRLGKYADVSIITADELMARIDVP
jgi:uncharacterized protein